MLTNMYTPTFSLLLLCALMAWPGPLLATPDTAPDNLQLKTRSVMERMQFIQHHRQHMLRSKQHFHLLDTDQDGYISRSEAEQSESLMDIWDIVDQNQDDNLDPVEFSVFDEQYPQPEEAP